MLLWREKRSRDDSIRMERGKRKKRAVGSVGEMFREMFENALEREKESSGVSGEMFTEMF